MIPKQIFSIWLSDKKTMPAIAKKCLASQKLKGYKHKLITLKEANVIAPKSKYLKAAITAKKWVKASDWLRLYLLNEHGGIYLDSDVEILKGKNFDLLLDNKMFLGVENDFKDGRIVIGNAVIGSEAGHPFLKKLLVEMNKKFKGDDDLTYESGMDLLNVLGVKYQEQFTLMSTDVFYPYNNLTKEKNITDNSITIHHFMDSWVIKKKAPKSL